jgi:hypothetical protein
VFPFWIFSLFTNNEIDTSTKTLTKLFRLAKLTRFFRIGSILKRWEARSNIKYAKMALIKWAGLIVLICHWLACMWMITVHMWYNPRVSTFVFVSVLLAPSTTINPCVLFWWDVFASYPIPPPRVVEPPHHSRPDNVLNLPCSHTRIVPSPRFVLQETWYYEGGHHGAGESGYELYAICFYWSLQTISTIGYGDVANPQNVLERTAAIVAMTVGSVTWAYIVGTMCALFTALDREQTEFHHTMDKLNDFMADRRLAQPLREKLRDYFRTRWTLSNARRNRDLIEMMSPSLKGLVASATCLDWIRSVKWYVGDSPAPHSAPPHRPEHPHCFA